MKYASVFFQYSKTIKLKSAAECTPCDAGKFCPSMNMTVAGDPCTAGFYCVRGSPFATPVGEAYGDECPTGKAQQWFLYHI